MMLLHFYIKDLSPSSILSIEICIHLSKKKKKKITISNESSRRDFKNKLHVFWANKQAHSDSELVLVGTDGETAAETLKFSLITVWTLIDLRIFRLY